MLRLRARTLRRLPFGRPPPGPPGRPPPPKGRLKPPPPPANDRCGRSAEASFTRRLRPSSSCPSSFWIAAAAASSVANETNANPRGRPLMRSVGIATSVTSPAWANTSWRRSRVVSKLKFPTKTFVPITLLFSLGLWAGGLRAGGYSLALTRRRKRRQPPHRQDPLL